MTPEEVVNLKNHLISETYVKPAYVLWHKEFSDFYGYTHEVVVTALAELHGDGLVTEVAGMNCVNLTGKGIEAAKQGYIKYLKNEQDKDENLSKQLRLNSRMNWWILIISVLSLVVGIIALFK